MERAGRLEKRFVIQEDAYAREKLHAYRAALERLQKKHPEIVGATAYGSLTKGTASESSDVDSFVFIDVVPATIRIERLVQDEGNTEAGPMPPAFNSRLLLMYETYENPTDEERTAEMYYRRAQVKAHYEAMIADAVREEFGRILNEQKRTRPDRGADAPVPSTLDVSIILIPMSGPAIDAVVAERSKSDGERRPEMGWSIPGRTTKKGKRREFFQAKNFASFLAPLFMLEIGSGLAPLRERVLRRLNECGPRGEEMWAELRTFLYEWESESGERAMRVPETLADAMRTYAPRIAGS